VSYKVTSGSLPTVSVGTEAVGYFTTNYWGAQAVSFEFSLDGATWSESVTVLGGAISQEWRTQFEGKRAYGKVKLTPTVVGDATFMIRVKTAAGETGPFQFVDVSAFQAVADFPAISFEVSTNGTTWTRSGNPLSVAVTSDGGFIVYIGTTERYVRLNGTNVVDCVQSGVKFLKFSDSGAYQWFARSGAGNSSGNRMMADANGIYFVWNGSTSSATFTSADSTTLTVPARTAAREWNITKMNNSGVWQDNTRIRWSAAGSGSQVVSDVAIGGGILLLSIPVEWTTHTVTYGQNDKVLNVTASGSVIRGGWVALETATMTGKHAGHLLTSNSGNRAAVAVTAAGRSVILGSSGSSSSTRTYSLLTRDTEGVDKGGITITAPGGSSSFWVAADESNIVMLMGKTGSSTQTWTASNFPSSPLTVGTNNQIVSWKCSTETQTNQWKSSSSVASVVSTGEVFATSGDFTFSYGSVVARYSADTGTAVWVATSTAGIGGGSGTADVDTNGNLVVEVAEGTLTDSDGTSTTVLSGATRRFVTILNTDGDWGKRAISAGVGGTEPSAPFSVDWPFMEVAEDTSFSATVIGFDPEFSPGAAILQVWDPRKDDWVDNPSSFAPETNGVYPATINVTMGADILVGAEVEVTPTPNFFGDFSVLFRWKIVDDAFQTRFGPSAEFVVTWTSDAPTAPAGVAPTLFEDDGDTMVIFWTDPTAAGGAQGNYEVYLSEVEADGTNWRPKSWSKSDAKHTDEVTIAVTSLSTTDLEATLTITPKKNKSGDYRFAVKVKQLAGDKEESPFTVFEGTITNLPDIPEIDGRFPVIDWDGDDWDLQIGLTPDGPWSDCITLDDGTKLCVDGNEVVVVEKGSDSKYVYYIRASDSTGQVSQPKRVIGFHGNGATGAYPQRIIRNGSGVVTDIEPMFFLFGITALRFEEGLDGVGYAEVTVASDQLKRRAEESSTTVRDLLDPLSVELVVTFQGQPVFVGPITEVEWESARPTTYITARGLLHYFDNRIVKVDTEYEEADLSDVAATIAANSQSEPWGGLGIGTDTTNCETLGTLSLRAGTTALDALNAVAEKLDGPEVWVDPATRMLMAKPTRGTDQRSRVRITSGVADLADLRSRGETVVTVARVVGADDGTGGNYEAVFASTTKLGIYGRVERNYSAPQLTSNTECAAVAQRIVQSRQQTTPALTLALTVTPQRVFSLLDLGVGDVITVDVEDGTFGRILGDYRIVNRAADLVDQADGTYQIRLNIEPAIYIDGRLIGSRSRFNPAMATELTSLAVNQRRG
jgi:hypothetical protein